MDSSQLQRIEKKLDRILEESNDLKLRMSLLEQRLTIFDARLDRLEVRMDRIEQKFEQAGKMPTLEDAISRSAPVPSDLLPRPVPPVTSDLLPRPAPPPAEHNPRPLPTLIKEREQEDNWFEKHLQQQLEEDRRNRNDESTSVPYRAFTRFDRG